MKVTVNFVPVDAAGCGVEFADMEQIALEIERVLARHRINVGRVVALVDVEVSYDEPDGV